MPCCPQSPGLCCLTPNPQLQLPGCAPWMPTGRGPPEPQQTTRRHSYPNAGLGFFFYYSSFSSLKLFLSLFKLYKWHLQKKNNNNN